jgi:cephalosporin hydroxylase
MELFGKMKKERIASYSDDSRGVNLGKQFNIESCKNGYTYNFSWMGVPIIQYPQDMIMMQEIIFNMKPELIIETGVAHGGSLVFYSSLLELMGKGRVIGVDIEIRQHNRDAIESHPMYKRISLVEGSSVDPDTVKKVENMILPGEKTMVILDSKHTHDHVLQELVMYSNFVSPGGYLVVFDTTVETFDNDVILELAKNYRFTPWGKGSNPRSAIETFLETDDSFYIEHEWHRKCMVTNCWEGVLRKRASKI